MARNGVRGLLSDFFTREGGNIATMAALMLPFMLGVAALAVDEAALYHQQRQLQASVDLAALHAAGTPGEAGERALLALVDAQQVEMGVSFGQLDAVQGGPLRVETGRYTPDRDLTVAERFVPGATPANAARVTYEQPGEVHFARTFMRYPPRLRASAIAAATPEVGFSIGSRLAGLDNGLLNDVLGGLLGTSLSLTLLDYERLAGLDVDLLRFMDALAGRVGLSAGTYGELVEADVRLSDIAAALAAGAGGSDPMAASLLLNMAGAINDSIFVDMVRLVALDGLADVGVGTIRAGVEAGVNALEILSVAAMLADGARQGQVDLSAGVTGLAATSVKLAIGEPPQGAWYTVGGVGAYVRTAQVRLKLTLSVLGNGGGLGALAVNVPIYAELAPAEAQLVALHCPPGRPDLGAATIAARPGLLRLAVGHMSEADFYDTRKPLAVSRVALVDILGGVAEVTARADIAVSQINPQNLYFTHVDVAAGTVRSVSTQTAVRSLTYTLMRNLDLRLNVLRVNLLGALLSGVTGVVAGLVAPLTPVLDNTLNASFALLGIRLGEADVRVSGFVCRPAVLVQ